MKRLEKILQAWWHSETLSPGELPKMGTSLSVKYTKQSIKKFQQLYNGVVSMPNEWKDITFKKEDMKRKIGLYGNCYLEYELIEFQRDVAGVEDEIHNKSFKNCYGFYVEFDENNKFDEKSLFIPHVNFYVKLARENKLTMDQSFFDQYKDVIQYLKGQAESINGGIFSTDWLSQFMSEFEKNFAIPSSDKRHYLELLVQSSKTAKTPKFNSFFSEDILKAKEDMNKSLDDYLSKPAKKIDIDENREFIEKSLNPLNVPLGRWPSNIEHRASLMQQVAVNEFFLSKSHISSVNGPPGTGKTTLLKDIFAEIVVKKAKAMLSFRDDPSKALVSTGYKIEINNRYSKEKETVKRIVYDIHSSISQYSAVVASSNNTAVENISKDLPKATEIDEMFKDHLKPLNYASGVCAEITDEKAWGMFSIPLGKGENIKNAASLLAGEKFSVLNSLKVSSKNPQKGWEKACDEFDALYKEVEKLRQSLANAVKYPTRYKMEEKEDFFYSTDAFWEDSKEQYEKRQEKVLYQTNTFNEKRSILFLKALAVLRHFLSVNQRKLDAGLTLLDRRNQMNLNHDEEIRATKAMWNSVHCICPVVSTTFASFASMYRGMPKDFIPYLFIDEAGQATPLQAVGAIWRSRKVLVVGDPKQIEPVQTLHPSVIVDIRKMYGIDEELFNVKSSVQSVADRANQYGTDTGPKEGPEKWIGIPLWVHRRCIEPMFSISNELAYEGNMVLAKKKIGVGEWLDCKGPVTKNQYVKEQAEMLFAHVKGRMEQVLRKQLLESINNKLQKGGNFLQLLQIIENHDEVEDTWSLNKRQALKLMEKYREFSQGHSSSEMKAEIASFEEGEFSCPSIYVITPFSAVKKELQDDIKKELFAEIVQRLNTFISVKGHDEEATKLGATFREEAKQFKKCYETWLDENIGTVHTFQGKEATIVYFVTGTDRSKLAAAEWACKEPNLLNVAATRAKEEFYMIGDQELLEPFPNYQKMIKIMNHFKDEKKKDLGAEVVSVK